MIRSITLTAKSERGATPAIGFSDKLSFVSLGLFAAGLLLLFEVVRPFRDLSIDGPIAMAAWSFGFLLAVVAVWWRRGSRTLGIVALLLNLLAIVIVSAMLFSLTRMKLF